MEIKIKAPECQRNHIERHKREDMIDRHAPLLVNKIENGTKPRDAAWDGKDFQAERAGYNQEKHETSRNPEMPPFFRSGKREKTNEEQREDKGEIPVLMIGNEHGQAQCQQQQRVRENACFGFFPEEVQATGNRYGFQDMIQHRHFKKT